MFYKVYMKENSFDMSMRVPHKIIQILRKVIDWKYVRKQLV